MQCDELYFAIRTMPKDSKTDIDQLITVWRQTFPLKQEIESLKNQLTDEVVRANKEKAAIKADHLEQLRAVSGARLEAPTDAVVTMTVREAVTRLLESDEIKPRSKKRYRSIYDHFGAFVGWDTQLHTIGNNRFAEYAEMINRDATKAVATQANYITIVQMLK